MENLGVFKERRKLLKKKLRMTTLKGECFGRHLTKSAWQIFHRYQAAGWAMTDKRTFIQVWKVYTEVVRKPLLVKEQR